MDLVDALKWIKRSKYVALVGGGELKATADNRIEPTLRKREEYLA